jgi:threonine synthase
LTVWRELCSRCGRVWPFFAAPWKCPCGGLIDLCGPVVDRALPPGAGLTAVTPLRKLDPAGFVKLEFEHLTGSFKDRGAAAMIGVASAHGVDTAVVDSSGNAGKAAAAYCQRAGLGCTVFVPAGTPEAKLEAISGYGAELVEAPGGRAAAACAAQARVREGGGWYASHVYRPVFHHGVKTLAFELHAQVDELDAVVVPAGNGTLVIGLWLGFSLLVACGQMIRRPAIVAVQADRCAPLVGRPVDREPTMAQGIAIPDPPRAAQIRGAVAASGGRLVTVTEAEIAAARADLAEMGYGVEPTGAVAWAARRQVQGGRTVFVLTGR